MPAVALSSDLYRLETMALRHAMINSTEPIPSDLSGLVCEDDLLWSASTQRAVVGDNDGDPLYSVAACFIPR